MTPAQYSTFKAAILADANLTNLVATGQTGAIAQYYAQDSTFIVWRSIMTSDMSRLAVTSAIDQLDNLTTGKRDSLLWLLQADVKPSDINVRTGIDNLCGSQTALKTALQAAQKRNANLLEKIFATGTGTNANPGNLVVELIPGISDVDRALSS